MTDDDRKPWALFLGGHWQKTRPLAPGQYPVATREGGLQKGLRTVTKQGELGIAPGEPGWLGYWWSRPLPPLPTPAPEEW